MSKKDYNEMMQRYKEEAAKEIGVDLITQVTAYEYDAIAERFVSLEFGNYKKTVKTAIEYIINKSK
jgi:hypothetical protein